MQQNSFSLKKIILGGSIALILLAGIFVYISLRLHIVKSTPNLARYPSSLSVVVLEFNQKLNAAAIEKQFQSDPTQIVSFSFPSTATIKITDKTLKIDISSTPLPGKYFLTLKNIQSEGGEVFSQKLDMNIVSTPYANMSDEEKLLFDEAAAEGEEQSDNPLVSILPHETEQYKITYSLPTEDAELPATITITMKFFQPGDNALPATPAEIATYQQDIRTYRKEALAYLASKNIDVNRFIMAYSEPDLTSEFPAGFTPTAIPAN